jgi:lipoprotein-anchoring transpeptidase ErfK/SrfK
VLGQARLGLATGIATLLLVAVPAVAAAGGPSAAGGRDQRGAALPAAKAPAEAHLAVNAKGPHKGRLRVGHRSRAIGYLRPFVPGQRVKVALVRGGHTVVKRNPVVKRVHGADKGRFELRSTKLLKPGAYRMVAKHLGTRRQGRAVARSAKFHIKYPNLGPASRSSSVRLFNRLLAKQGYYTTHGRGYSTKTGFAVMAFRKVNGMNRTFNASPGIFRKLAAGRGAFHLKYPGAGKHVEVDISKQVMVLASHGRPQYTFHVSTGAAVTPTIRGHYTFYRRDAGYNAEGMYYSVYWHNGYAIHGYHSVPPYPASHGCVRNPIPESKFIYNWVSLGMSIYTYG